MRIVLNCFMVVLMVFGVLMFAGNAQAGNATQLFRPKTDGRPVYAILGKAVVYPEGVEDPPAGYHGTLRGSPIAVIRANGQIVGEVYAAPLKGSSVDESKEMAASASGNKGIYLLKRTTVIAGKRKVEVVTLKLDAKSKIGTPWVIHSLYFPQGNSSVTFKLIASEERFSSVQPYFEAMLFP